MYRCCRRSALYGHTELLAVAQSINGIDFVPFNDAIFVKQPGLGGSVAWRAGRRHALELARLGSGHPWL